MTSQGVVDVFGGIGRIVLVLVLRVVQAKWRSAPDGVGLDLRRRLLAPAGMVVLALIQLPDGFGTALGAHRGWVLAALAVAVAGGIARAALAVLTRAADGVHARDGVPALAVEAVVTAVTAALVGVAFLPQAGVHAAAVVWMISIALFEVTAVLATVARTTTPVRSPR